METPCRRPDRPEYLRRKAKTRATELKWERYAKQKGFTLTHTSIEEHFTQRITDQFQSMHWNNMRYLPDYFVQLPDCKTFWAEVKSGTTVEQGAYEQYLSMSEQFKVWIIFDVGAEDELRAVKIEDVEFREGDWVDGTEGFTYKTVNWSLTP